MKGVRVRRVFWVAAIILAAFGLLSLARLSSKSAAVVRARPAAWRPALPARPRRDRGAYRRGTRPHTRSHRRNPAPDAHRPEAPRREVTTHAHGLLRRSTGQDLPHRAGIEPGPTQGARGRRAYPRGRVLRVHEESREPLPPLARPVVSGRGGCRSGPCREAHQQARAARHHRSGPPLQEAAVEHEARRRDHDPWRRDRQRLDRGMPGAE